MKKERTATYLRPLPGGTSTRDLGKHKKLTRPIYRAKCLEDTGVQWIGNQFSIGISSLY